MDNIFDAIAAKLSAAGMDDASVAACREALAEEFSGLSDEEFAKKLESQGGVDGIADSILKKYDTAKKISSDSENDIISIDDDMFSDEPADPYAADTAADADQSANENSTDVVLSETDGDYEVSSVNADEYFNDDNDVKVKQPDQKKKDGRKPADLSAKQPEKKKKTSVKNMSPRAKTAYVIGLILLIPLLIALVVVITVLFLALYAAVIALVVAFSVALVVIAAVGTALSLMAIIFGVIQLVQGAAAPIGIYEIGLGVAAGGITLGVSILLYNFVVRLAPFLFKKMFVLYKFLFRQLTKLLGFVKGACSKL
ncbi:MAG: hypothetical protein IJT49_04760 [Clostridia bacterium]|nr:hypothetical protein [Clostridia bacterium]